MINGHFFTPINNYPVDKQTTHCVCDTPYGWSVEPVNNYTALHERHLFEGSEEACKEYLDRIA